MNSRTNAVKSIEEIRCTPRASISRSSLPSPLVGCDSFASTLDLSDPNMERRLSARCTWEFLGEGRSTFYARMNPNDPNYDPHFPRPIPSSTTGRGPRRWKLGALIGWLKLCESNAAGA